MEIAAPKETEEKEGNHEDRNQIRMKRDNNRYIKIGQHIKNASYKAVIANAIRHINSIIGDT